MAAVGVSCVNVGFRAVRRLMEIKGSVSALPREFAIKDYNAKIDDALAFIQSCTRPTASRILARGRGRWMRWATRFSVGTT